MKTQRSHGTIQQFEHLLRDRIAQLNEKDEIYSSTTSSNYFEDVATEVHDILQFDYEIDCSVKDNNIIVTFYDSGYEYVKPISDIQVTSDPRETAQIIAHEAEMSYSDDLDTRYYEGNFTEIASKPVIDSDGFLTDYTMYRDTDSGEYVFVFGDRDSYRPENGDLDWSCDSESDAWEWFNSYGEDA